MGSRPTGVNTEKRPPTSLLGVGDGYDDLTGRFLATLVFALLLQEAEGQGCLRGCSGLGYVDDAELLALQVFGQLVQVVLADVVSGKEDDGTVLLLLQPGEAVAQCLDDGTCAQVAAADAGYDYDVAILAQRPGRGLQVIQMLLRDGGGEVQPAQEVVAQARAVLQHFLCVLYLLFVSVHILLGNESEGLLDVQSNHACFNFGLSALPVPRTREGKRLLNSYFQAF